MSVRARHCERCKREIPAERLEVLPQTRMCVECVRAVGGEFDLAIVPENLAKAGSLKKNYGSFEVFRVRKR
jgi:hypothetical protein